MFWVTLVILEMLEDGKTDIGIVYCSLLGLCSFWSLGPNLLS